MSVFDFAGGFKEKDGTSSGSSQSQGNANPRGDVPTMQPMSSMTTSTTTKSTIVNGVKKTVITTTTTKTDANGVST